MQTIVSTSAKLPPITAGIGFFDGVHLGHCSLIQSIISTAKEDGNASAVVTFKRHPREVLHADYRPQLINTLTEKIELLGKTGLDYVIVLDFDEDMSLMNGHDFIAYLKHRYNLAALYIGYDHRFGHNRSDEFEDYLRYGTELGVKILRSEAFLLGSVPVSSSSIRRFLTDGDVAYANQMLSYPYFLTGKVVEGFGIGRKIGFRTANIEVEEMCKLIPCNGVYAVFVTTSDGSQYKGMLNIGNRPTVHNSTERVIEVNIFDYEKNLYGDNLTIWFVSYIREEKKMDSVSDLRKQLSIDRQTALSML